MHKFGIDISKTEYICRHANRTMAQTPRNDLDPHLWTRRKMPRKMPTCKTDDESLEEEKRYGTWPRAKHNVYDHLWTRRKMPGEMPTCKTDDDSLQEFQRLGNWPRAYHNVYNHAQSTESTVRVMTTKARRKVDCQCKLIKFDHDTRRGEYACTCALGEKFHAQCLTCISSEDYDVCKKGICACE